MSLGTENGPNLRGFLEEAPDALFIHDLSGRILDANRVACESLGYTRSELLSMTVFDFSIKIDRDSAPARWKSISPGTTVSRSGIHRRHDGSLFPVEVRLGFYPMGDSGVIIALARDVSLVQKTREALLRQIRINRALSEVNQAIIRMEEEDRLFPTVCEVAVSFGGMTLAYVAVNDERSLRLKIHQIVGSGQEYLKDIVFSSDPALPEGHGPAGTCFRENRIVIVNDFQKDPLTAPWHDRASLFGWGSSGTFPIARGGRPFAVLGVYHPEKEAFDPEILRLLDEMSRDISFALDNFDRDRERREAILKVADNERRFRAYFDGALMGIVALSPDGHFQEANDSFCRLTGYPREKILSLNWEDLEYPDDISLVRERLEKIGRGEIDSDVVDSRFLHQNGEVLHVHAAIKAIRKTSGNMDSFVVNIEDVTGKKKSQETIWRQANFDMLTGLPNRFMFFDRLRQEIMMAHREHFSLALLFIDLDRFKEVNDTMGHSLGDKLLVEASSRIVSCLRESDTVSRFGGDEFTAVLSRLPGGDPVEGVAEKILNHLSEPFSLSGTQESVFISASIGITLYPSDGDDAEKLLQNADQAMYVAKNAGRNRFAYFTSALQEKAQLRLMMHNELRNALDRSELILYFQPIVDFATKRMVKAEALLRWNHPKRGLILPAEFISLAEETGLIVGIGNFVFRESVRWMMRWAAILPPDFQMSVNMSAVQFESRKPLVEEWLSVLEASGLSGKNIAIEITESLLMGIGSAVTEKLLAFARNGIQVSIDDFGTGYSSLAYLRKFHIDTLKIDQSFVRNLEVNEESRILSEGIVILAHKLGLDVVAEGVETQGQFDFLSSIGCNYAQGFFLSRPLSAGLFEEYLRTLPS